MQSLARDGYTAAEVASLLTGDRLVVTPGLELLGLDLEVVADISEDLVGGSVAWNGDARIHRTTNLTLSYEVEWGRELVRPYMLLTDGTVSVRVNGGVFMLTTPEYLLVDPPPDRRVTVPGQPVVLTDEDGNTILTEDGMPILAEQSSDPQTYVVPGVASSPVYVAQGYDRLYLTDRKVAAAYTVAAGTTYYAALVQVFEDAGLTGYLIDGAAAELSLPVDKTWPLVGKTTDPDQTSTPVTWLRVINDLLSAINFRALWADENGIYRCQRYQPPQERAPEYTFTASDPRVTIVGENRTRFKDVWKTPSRWVFIWQNREGGEADVEGDGKYEFELADDHPMSAVSRGLDWPEVYKYDAATQDVLEELGDRRVADDLRGTEWLKVTTGPWPVAGHADVYTYEDSDGSLKVIASDWEFDLTGGDVSWSWEVVDGSVV